MVSSEPCHVSHVLDGAGVRANGKNINGINLAGTGLVAREDAIVQQTFESGCCQWKLRIVFQPRHWIVVGFIVGILGDVRDSGLRHGADALLLGQVDRLLGVKYLEHREQTRCT